MSIPPSTPQEKWEAWFQSVWSEREDHVYPRLFGSIGTTIANIPPVLFQSIGVPNIEEWWLTHGVVTSPPQPNRAEWVYLTSGLSNPWGVDPADVDKRLPSGLGMELMMETREEAVWATPILHWLMAVQILAATGHLKGETVRYNDLVPLGRSVAPEKDSLLRNLVLVRPPLENSRFVLPSGTVDLLLCVGITDAEHEFALQNGSEELLTKLKAAGAYPATVPERPSVV